MTQPASIVRLFIRWKKYTSRKTSLSGNICCNCRKWARSPPVTCSRYLAIQGATASTADSIETALESGVDRAMNLFNPKRKA